MESKGAMDGPGYEPMGDGRKREGDYRGDWRGQGLKLARILETLATTAASTPRACAGGRENAGDRWRARASARAKGGAREREELRRRRMDGVRDPSTLRCPPQREAWWFLAASGVSKTQRPNKTQFPSLSLLNCLPRHQNADVAP